MNSVLKTAVEDLINNQTGEAATITVSRQAGGGCIHRAEIVELKDGRRYFVKSNSAPPPGIFEREAEGLAALAATNTLKVPQLLGIGTEPSAFLVMEAIDIGPPGTEFNTTFGRRFAGLHLANREAGSRIDRFGFDHDNHLGATPQPNTWTGDWTDFFRRYRLGHQLALARSSGVSDRTMDRLGDRLLGRLEELIGQPEEPPSLLHGDLWSGNYMVDNADQPVLIDPAVYYGRREADLAMTFLFGGFGPRFYAAYEEAWPLEPGSKDRLEIYKLYHLLNHLNLFGRSYLYGCVSIMKRFAG